MPTKKYIFNLEKIECLKCCPPTAGSDRCEITIFVDGKRKPKIVKDFSPGSRYNINKQFRVDGSDRLRRAYSSRHYFLDSQA